MQDDANHIAGFEHNYKKLTRAAKAFSRLGYVGIALDVGSGVANIAEACTAKPGSVHCEKTKYTQTGKVVGSVGGGMIGGTVGAQVGVLGCSLVFGLETAGLAIPVCIAVFGIGGGYAAGKYGGKKGGESGEFIYKSYVRQRN